MALSSSVLARSWAGWSCPCWSSRSISSRSFSKIKALLFEDGKTAHQLLSVLADSVASYLNAQIEAGAQAVAAELMAGLSDETHPQTCATCHDPHVGDLEEGNVHQLRTLDPVEVAYAPGYEPGDAGQMASAILQLAEDPERFACVKDNGIELSKRFDRAAIAQRTEQVLSAVERQEPLPQVNW